MNMAQMLRVYKPEIPMLVRSYGSQRHQHNYYEVLRISPDSTQKEIKQAFFKLSKKMHPDIKGNKGHTDFVKLNEAYSVLSKEDTRRQYDMSLRYNDVSSNRNPSSQYYHSSGVYSSYREWEANTVGGPKPHYPTKPPDTRSSLALCLGLIVIGTCFQMMVVRHSVRHKNQMLRRSMEIENDLEETRKEAESRTPEENMEHMVQMQEQYRLYTKQQFAAKENVKNNL